MQRNVGRNSIADGPAVLWMSSAGGCRSALKSAQAAHARVRASARIGVPRGKTNSSSRTLKPGSRDVK
jgi:hypothetical protein